MYNQFLGAMGPRPDTAQPLVEDPNQEMFDWSMGNVDQEDAIRAGIHDIVQSQMAGTREEAKGLAAKGAGMGLKEAVPQFGQAVRGAADYVMAPVKSAVKSAQNYVMGGKTTAQAGTQAAGTTGADLMGLAGKGLGAAGVAYNTYQSVNAGLGNARDLKSALRENPWMPQHEQDQLRKDSIRAGLQASRTGAASGALSGFTAGGPVGAAVGAGLGGAGGQIQAISAARGSRGSDYKNYGQAAVDDQADTMNASTDWLARTTDAPTVRRLGVAPESEDIAFWRENNAGKAAGKASRASGAMDRFRAATGF